MKPPFTNDILGHDHMQWHPQFIRHYTNLWPWHRTRPYYRVWPYTKFREVSIEHLQGVRHAKNVLLLLWTPGPVPFGTCICSNIETSLSKTGCVWRTFENPSVLRFYIVSMLVDYRSPRVQVAKFYGRRRFEGFKIVLIWNWFKFLFYDFFTPSHFTSSHLGPKWLQFSTQFCFVKDRGNVVVKVVSFGGSKFGGGVFKLLTCRSRDPGFEPQSRHFDFRNWVYPASKSRRLKYC